MTPLATDFVTILRCAQGKSATKAIHPGKDGPIIGDYNAGLWFSVDMAPVDGIESLAGVLDRTSEDARAFVIRGEPLPDTDLECCRRLLHPQPDGTPPTFREEPRRWALLDVDTVPWPPRGREFLWNWSTGPLSGTYLRSLLPVEFHSVLLVPSKF